MASAPRSSAVLVRPGTARPSALPSSTIAGKRAMLTASPSFSIASLPSVICKTNDRTPTRTQNMEKNCRSAGPFSKVLEASALNT